MKFPLALLSIILFPFCAQAQDTIYIDKNYNWTDKTSATEYALLKKSGQGLTVSFYALDHRLKGFGDYDTYESKKRVRNGKQSFLYPSGTPKKIIHYNMNKLDGEATLFYEDGTIKRHELYNNGVFVNGKCFDKTGKEIAFFPISKPASFPGGDEALKEFVRKNLYYPEKALINYKEGVVMVRFIVDATGYIREPQITKSVSKSLDKAALKMIRKMAKKHIWIPATDEDQKPVSSSYQMPVRFTLPN